MRFIIYLFMFLFYDYRELRNRFRGHTPPTGFPKTVWHRWMITTELRAWFITKEKNNTGRDAVYPDLKNERTPLFLPLLHSRSSPRVIANAIWIWEFQEAFTIKVSSAFACYYAQKPSINSSYCLKLVLTERPVCSSSFSFSCLPLFIYYYYFFLFFLLF
jgi:hypothetical protein